VVADDRALLMVSAAGWTQQDKKARPDCKDFAVAKIYTGAPVAPKTQARAADESEENTVKTKRAQPVVEGFDGLR
jgi:hypothetical protein